MQVRGTIFNELDDEKVLNQIDFVDFEDKFKMGGPQMLNGSSDVDGLINMPSKRFKKAENVSVLEHTRLRNIGKLVALFRRSFGRDFTINRYCAIICSNLSQKIGYAN